MWASTPPHSAVGGASSDDWTPTSSFSRAIRASLLWEIDLVSRNAQGYALQVGLLHRPVTAGARVRDIPIRFIDCTAGQFKLRQNAILEFIVNALWIRLQSSKTFLKFPLVGARGIVIDFGAFNLLLTLGQSKFIASPIAVELSIISNFLLNRFWISSLRQTRERRCIKGIRFNLASLVVLRMLRSLARRHCASVCLAVASSSDHRHRAALVFHLFAKQILDVSPAPMTITTWQQISHQRTARC